MLQSRCTICLRFRPVFRNTLQICPHQCMLRDSPCTVYCGRQLPSRYVYGSQPTMAEKLYPLTVQRQHTTRYCCQLSKCIATDSIHGCRQAGSTVCYGRKYKSLFPESSQSANQWIYQARCFLFNPVNSNQPIYPTIGIGPRWWCRPSRRRRCCCIRYTCPYRD